MNQISAKSRRDSRRIVFVTFESEFAPLGGLAAVMRALPRQMAKMHDGTCMTIAPFFKHITRCNAKRMAALQPTGRSCVVRFGADEHNVAILRHEDADGFATYLLDTPDFFNAPCDCGNPPAAQAPCNPYLDPEHPERLLQDALFFCAAVPKALLALGYERNLVLSLQDWQTACAALMVKHDPQMSSVVCTLTVHNPYDKPLSDEDLALIYDHSLVGPTVLTKMLPFIDGPPCTVSENFASELVQEPLHTEVYAPHLKLFFQDRGIIGVDNGLFAKLDFPETAIVAGRRGDYQPILEEKRRRREALVRVLESYHPKQARGTLDGLAEFEGPIFLMFGRDDPRQKGYDIAAAAIQRVPVGMAKYIFTPIPGDEGMRGLQFLFDLADARPGEVKVFPFRLAKGYQELQQGSSFLLMCSLYEPFGGATEGYAVGTPVVARATGGLVQQVAPFPGGAFSHAVRDRTQRFHARNASPTGFLFREPDLERDVLVEGWQRIVDCDYFPDGDRVNGRIGIRLFDAMVQEAAWALEDAGRLYLERPLDYARMIASGFEMLTRFSWDRAVREYQRLYDKIRL